MTKRVAVLKGGWSSEREVSLSSGRDCAKALREAGYEVVEIDVGHDLAVLIAELEPRPDVVFNALHGRGGEDGTVQGVLEFLRIPYTHSGILASAVAMDKPLAKEVFARAGLPLAEGRLVPKQKLLNGEIFPAPFVVKPPNEGSSVGVRIVREGDNSWKQEAAAWQFGDMVLVEKFVPGRELTVAVMGDRALGVCEILAHHGAFYDYESKYAAGGSDHLIPAPIHPIAYQQAMEIAVRAHQALGCRGVSRADLRYDDTKGEPGRVILLEINTQPGMTPTSLVPDMARAAGISFRELVVWMVEHAACDA
jgi:D-alanine-D-alanine ligase